MCVCVYEYIYIYEQVFYISGDISFFYMWADTDHLLPNYTTFIAIPAGFTHTAVETACINKEKDQCLLRLHSKNTRHYK